MQFKDPFCDFDLIFSSAYSSKKIVELPVYYRAKNMVQLIFLDLKTVGS